MQKSIKLILGCHCHQPVGNFDHVFDDAYSQAYLPFIETLERYPAVKFVMHYSGPLFDWFESKRPEFLERLSSLAKSGQVEIMGGGYYEPMLCALPERDGIDQIRRMAEFCEKHFGNAPKGMWLTERVWEPHMPKLLREAGIEYTALDDSHFLCSGLTPEELFGYYVTESEGKALKVFPILERLRYLVPFHPVRETLEFLEQCATEDGTRCAVLHDDGEKFGVWPGTHHSVYEEGWLDEFFQALTDNQDWLKCVSYSEHMDVAPAFGRTYISCASYDEMMEWALPTHMQRRLALVKKQIDENPETAPEHKLFVRGGFWRSFLAKYDEANNIQKKMLRVSEKLNALEELNDERIEKARRLLHQGQCNCAYWHGVFGGLYLNHLRSAVYEKLIAAEALIDEISRGNDEWVHCEAVDFDADGNDEVILENSCVSLGFSPCDGGTMFELDYRKRPFNFLNTLTRREEPYHDDLRSGKTQVGGEDSGEVSIHELAKAKESGLDKYLVYDAYRRVSMRDHFLCDTVRAEDLWSGEFDELGDFVTGNYAFDILENERKCSVEMKRKGLVQTPDPIEVEVAKKVTLVQCASSFEIRYDIRNCSQGQLSAFFGVEFAVNLLTGSAPDRYYRSDDFDLKKAMLGDVGHDDGLKHIALRDDWQKLECGFRFDNAARVYRFAIETVSQSEGGQERVYQGSIVVPCWHIDLAPGCSATHRISVEIVET